MDFYSHGRFRHREKERSARRGGRGKDTSSSFAKRVRGAWFRGNTRFKIMPDVSTTFTWNYIAERVPFDELARVYVRMYVCCVALAKSTEQIRGTRKCRSL